MTNHEKKDYADSVHVYLAFQRPKDGEPHRTIRWVIKDEKTDLALFEYKCMLLGGTWRIHRTVNARDTKKALRWLQHKLIDFPEGAGFVDSLWRTALLQPENVYGEKRFMLDVDTKDATLLGRFHDLLTKNDVTIDEVVDTPAGKHYITKPFDTREVCTMNFVSLQRDGYVFVKKVNGDGFELVKKEARIVPF